jgi:exodeoxyribonuclease-5
LANPSVKKVEDDADNQKISELFQILPLFAILQSGSDAKSTYSLIRAIPFESYLPLISKPYNDFVKSSLDEQSSVLADYTLQFVKSQYNKSNKFKNKLKNWANSSVKNLELTQDTRNRIINLDPSIVPPDPFSSQEEIGDDADSSRVVKLNGPDGKVISINLNTLNIGFTPNAEQLIALQQMVDFIEANPKDLDQKMFSLKGYAGTGKTSITKILLKYLLLRNIRTGLTATTHKAKSVLARATETQTSTLHKLLGLRPSPKPLEELDLSELNFLRTGEKSSAANVIIIDESSFISDSLYSFIEDEVNSRADLKIIFIGDPAQIKPVKQKHTSKVFTDISNSYELTTVERQTGDNPLGPILDAIRSNIKSPTRQFSTDSVINGNEGIGFVDSEEAFLSAAAKAFRSDNFATNRNFARIVTYSNDKVTDYNKNIRKSLGLTGEFREGEVLMSYQNAQYLSGDYLFKNSVDYVIIASEFVPSTEIGKRYLEDAMFTDKKLNTPVTVAGYRLLIQDLFDSSASPISIFVLDPNTSQESLDRLAEQADALDQQAKKTGVYKNFNGFTNSFLSTKAVEKNDKTKIKKGVDYGYAHTIHKSQGATYTNIFVDLTSLSQMTDIEQKNQLTYVGLSRATNIAYARVNKGDAASLPTDIEWNDSFTKAFSAAVGPVTYKYPLNISTYKKIKIMEDPSTGIRTFSYNLDIEKSKYMVDGKLVTKAITVPMKGILTEATVKEFIADYPNALVMFNDYDGNGNPIGSNSIWRLLGNNAAGVTTKHGPAPTKIGSDKHNKLSAMTDATLDDNKRIIDASLNAIENQLAAPGEKKFLVIDEYGFGQYMIGYVENQPTVQKPTLPVIAKQTFLYLSEQLYRKFGYINPHYLSFKEGRMLVQKGNAITDEDIIEQRKCNFKSK